ncbi:DUF3987 domain-containing protein [Streptomyces sp. NPDC051546]|uniref:DUF3987 domain-containing protein n=1 Tax=Streptomyces sp. NPDC051546 TaxID=3365655 RepID=UPI0037A4D3F2
MEKSRFDAMAYGPLGKAVKDAMPHTEADPIGVFAQTLSLYSAAINGFVIPPNERPIAVWTVLVGLSSIGRKGFAYDTAEQILSEAMGDFMRAKLRGGVTSGASLITTLYEAYNDDLVTEAGEDGRIFIVDAEWPDTLAAQNRDRSYATAFRNAWDGKPVTNTTKGKDGRRVEQSVSAPRLGYTAHIQPGLWHKFISATNALGGTYNRLLPVSVQYSKVLDDDNPLQGLAPSKSLALAHKWARAERRELSYAPAALRYKNDLKREYLELLGQMPEEVSCYVERSVEQIIRVASVLTAANRSTVIPLAAMKAARAFVEYSMETVKNLVAQNESARRGRGLLLDERIRKMLTEKGAMTRSQLYRSLGSRFTAAQIDAEAAGMPDVQMEKQETNRTGQKPVLFSLVTPVELEGSDHQAAVAVPVRRAVTQSAKVAARKRVAPATKPPAKKVPVKRGVASPAAAGSKTPTRKVASRVAAPAARPS